MPDVLERTFAALAVNALVNHPEIRPFAGGDPRVALDLADAVENDRNVFLMGEHGGFIFTWCAPACFEGHAMVRSPGRGKWGAAAARNAIEHMANEHGARHLWCRIQPERREVRSFVCAAGFTPCGQDVFDIGAGPQVFNLYEWRT